MNITFSDDVLFQIFIYLSVTDSVKFQRVSCNWKKVLRYMLPRRKHLNVSSEQNLSLILKKCPKICSLYLDKFSNKFLSLIRRKKILNIHTSHINCCDLSHICLFNNLKRIMCDNIVFGCHKCSQRILESPIIRYKCASLAYVPRKEYGLLDPLLKEIRLQNYVGFDEGFIKMLLSQVRIALNRFEARISMCHLSKICESFPNLTSLSLVFYDLKNPYNFKSIARLVRLERLKLSLCAYKTIITDSDLVAIFKTCINLQYVDIHHALLSDESIQYLSALNDLQSLRIFQSNFHVVPMVFTFFCQLENLKVFHFEGVLPYHSDKSISVFLNTCTKLDDILIDSKYANRNVIGQNIFNACIAKAKRSSAIIYCMFISDNTSIKVSQNVRNCITTAGPPSFVTNQNFRFCQVSISSNY
jgi:hypothetical protein